MRSRLTGGLALAAFLGVGLLAAGCGGGDDDLTKAEFQAQANAICKKGSKEIDAAEKTVFTQKGQAPSQAAFDKFVNGTLIPSVQSQIDGINDLNPPSADEDKVNAITDEAQAALDKVKQDPHQLAGSDPFKKANQLAKDYGLNECAG